jgi:hypothetical protein
MHRPAHPGVVRAAARAFGRRAGRHFEMASRGPRIHNIAAQFALSDTAQAHLAVEKGDKLGTIIVDCAR